MWNVATSEEETTQALQGQSVEEHRPLLDTTLLQAGRLQEEGRGGKWKGRKGAGGD